MCLQCSAYNAGTMSRQYTIRAIPVAVDSELRRRAKLESRSLNAVAIEALTRGLELTADIVEHADLDFLVGTWQEDPAVDQAIADFERIDDEVWK